MSVEDLPDSSACGCCEVAASPTPEEIRNRPGLTAIRYRIGTFSGFRQAMIEAISTAKVEVDGNQLRPLENWTARAGDDYGIAVLEMWAYLADILTFYQERIANESFLRTALLRESVLRLAALLDYEPAPGVAATAHLAFTLEKDRQVKVPFGLLVQSVPGQDEEPQKFEAAETVAADARLNSVRVFPRPQPHDPLARNSVGGILRPVEGPDEAAEPAPGDGLVIFSGGSAVFPIEAVRSERPFGSVAEARGFLDGIGFSLDALAGGTPGTRRAGMRMVRFFDPAAAGWVGATGRRRDVGERLMEREVARLAGVPEVGDGGVEEKEVQGIETTDGLRTLSWSPPIQSDGRSRVFEWSRKLRLFGYNAPESYMQAEPVSGSTEIRWRLVRAGDKDYGFGVFSTRQLNLDALYDLKVGARLLISAPDFTQIATVTAVNQTSDSKGPLNATVSRITLADSVHAIADLRQVVIYELAGPEVELWDRRLPATISGSTVYIPANRLDGVEPGRTLLLDDGQGLPQVVAVTRTTMEEGYLEISFTPPLARPLDGETAVLYGNVARATHGETVAGEVLGGGTASATFQSFRIRKSPVTFVPQPGAPHGAANTLEVRIGGVLWHEVDTLFDRDKVERVYTTAVDDENAMTARFGNGVEGARLPTGRNNVVAAYRQGLGRDGNVRAGALTTLLDRPVGLKSVTNPAEARGGADPESLDEARTNAPNTVRTFGRIVSLRDFEDAAREFAGVAKARAAPGWDSLEQVVRLTVAGDDGAAITGEPKKNLEKDLNSRRDANRKLVVETYERVFVRVEAVIYVDPDFVGEDVRAAARTALLDHFAFDSQDLGQPIHLSDVYRTLQDVGGVVAVDIDRLQFEEPSVRTSHGATNDAVQGHLRIFPKELASIRQPLDDAVVRIGTRRA